MSLAWYTCTVCIEDQSEPEHLVRTIDGDPICPDCITTGILPLFEAALKNEINFPPKWGPIEIDFESFEDLFSEAFRLAYREKIWEYDTPVPTRVYCQHRVPTTSKDKSAGDAETDFCNTFMGSVEAKGVSQCSSSPRHWMCMECRDIASPPPAIYTCDAAKAAAKADNESKAFDQTTRGKQWQQCPNSDCERKLDLKDGCNAMTCLCGEFFCFLCGEKADHDSDHWMDGNPCPRWGAVDAPNAIFDRPPHPTPRPGFPVVLLPVLPLAPANGEINVVLVFARNDRLHLDTEDATTLVDELSSEQHFMEDDEGNIPQIILEMKTLLRLLLQNLDWLKVDSALAIVDPAHMHLVVDPVDQTVKTSNFFIRDESLQARMRETHAAALEISGEDSVLFTVPVMEIFERYNTVHKPRFIEHLQEFDDAQNAGRALWADEEDRFVDPRNAMRMLWRQERENDEDELPRRPRRRASF